MIRAFIETAKSLDIDYGKEKIKVFNKLFDFGAFKSNADKICALEELDRNEADVWKNSETIKDITRLYHCKLARFFINRSMKKESNRSYIEERAIINRNELLKNFSGIPPRRFR